MRGADGPGGIGRAHGHDLGQGESEAEEARHDLRHAVHGVDAAGHGEIGADAVREQPLLDAAAADVEAEVLPPMRRIEPHAAVRGLAGLGHELAVAVQNPAGIGGEVVREDIPLLEEGQERADHRRVVALLRVPDVDHELGAALAGRPPGQAWHLHPHDLQRGRDHARLDPADETLVLVEDLERVVEIDAALRDDVRRGGEPRLADVQEGNDLGVAARNDVPGESREGGRPRAPRVHDRGDARPHAAEIGVDAVAVDALEDVRVQIDEARGDDLSPDLDGLRRLGGRNVLGDAGDHTVSHGDVAEPVEPRGRIHHGPTLEQEIVHAVLPAVVEWRAVAARIIVPSRTDCQGGGRHATRFGVRYPLNRRRHGYPARLLPAGLKLLRQDERVAFVMGSEVRRVRRRGRARAEA